MTRWLTVKSRLDGSPIPAILISEQSFDRTRCRASVKGPTGRLVAGACVNPWLLSGKGSPDVHDVIAVDDSPEVRVLLKVALGMDGWDVAVYASPISAIPEIEKVGTRVLITDINMPEMDGAKFAHAMREKYPDLPIIALTASLELHRLDRHDFTAAASKPCPLPQLIGLLSKYIGPLRASPLLQP